jgi:multicomponent Na+:H+ antiporter subunit E
MIKIIFRVPLAIEFLLFYLWELVLANLRVARDVMRPIHHLRPGVIAVPLDVDTDVQIVVLANLLTVTPGTISLDVSADRKTLYIHAVDASDIPALRASIKGGFENRVRKLFS